MRWIWNGHDMRHGLFITILYRSVTTLKPLTGEVSNIHHLISWWIHSMVFWETLFHDMYVNAKLAYVSAYRPIWVWLSIYIQEFFNSQPQRLIYNQSGPSAGTEAEADLDPFISFSSITVLAVKPVLCWHQLYFAKAKNKIFWYPDPM